MKLKTLLFVLLLFNVRVSFAQKKSKQKAPPGTVQINDTLFVDRTEIANVHWREYLFYLEKFDSLNSYKALPDTLVWRDTAAYNEPLTEYYFRHPMFNSYPVVGISHEQAIEFCKWRTFAANFFRYVKENNLTDWKAHLLDTFPIKFYFRLPTKHEWETLAAGKFSLQEYPYGYDSTYKKWKGKYMKAFKCKFPGDKPVDFLSRDRIYYTASVESYFLNSSRTNNMIGNVSEMVAEKGIAKGGSFEHKLEDCKIINNQYYTKPERWLGFRCVAVILK